MAYATKEQYDYSMTLPSNKYKWPKHWRATIDRLTQCQDPVTFSMKYAVRPINPEYAEWYAARDAHDKGINVPLPIAPVRHLDIITFDSLDELDQWAYTVWRMMK